MKISQRVHRIEARLGERYVAVYLFVGDRGILVVDTGSVSTIDEHVLPYLRSAGLDANDVRYVVSTHSDFDHIGGNRVARERFSHALFLSHVLDRRMVDDLEHLIEARYGEFIHDHAYDDTDDDSKRFIRDTSSVTTTDLAVVGGELIALSTDWDVQILHTPGHSRGSISVWDPDDGILVVGDAVLGGGLVNRDGSPAFPPTYRYVASYLATIDEIAAMSPATLATAHYPMMGGAQVSEFLGASKSFALRLERAIVAELATSEDGMTALELIDRIGPNFGSWPNAAALMYPVVGHLEKLSGSGHIELAGTSVPTRWRLR